MELVSKHFGKDLGCKVDSLCIINNKYSKKIIKKKVLSSDIIYVGGGNTQYMMKHWRRSGIDKILLEAYKKGIILSGISAGAICWCRYGCSDSRKLISPDEKLFKISGLNIINVLFCPHYDRQEYRRPELKAMMKKIPGVAIALDNCTALEIVDDNYRIISSKSSANAYKVYWKKGRYFEERIPQSKRYFQLIELSTK